MGGREVNNQNMAGKSPGRGLSLGGFPEQVTGGWELLPAKAGVWESGQAQHAAHPRGPTYPGSGESQRCHYNKNEDPLETWLPFTLKM